VCYRSLNRWKCDPDDARQIWYWDASTGQLRSQQGSCLAVYGGEKNETPYGWRCLDDNRQKWTFRGGYLKSLMGTCMAVYSGNNNERAYM